MGDAAVTGDATGAAGGANASTAAAVDPAKAATLATKPADAAAATTAAKPATDAAAAVVTAPTVDAKAFKLPDGLAADAPQIAAAVDFAKARGLTQDQAQALLERDVAFGKASRESQQAAVAEVRQGWAKEALADKALADETGTKLAPAVHENVNKALGWADAHGVTGLREMLDGSGLGNHPVAIRLFNALGKALGEDKPALRAGITSNGTKPPATLADALYASKG